MSIEWGEKTVVQRAIVSTTCDHCGREERGEPDGWVSIDFGHSDWGNDSVESDERWDACSAPCLVALLGKIADGYDPKHENAKPTLSVRLGELDLDTARALGSATWTDHIDP